MKIIRDDKTTSVDCFLDKSHRHLHIFAGKTKNGQWKDIRVTVCSIPNCITIDTYDSDTIIIGIPQNLLQKGIVTLDIPKCPICKSLKVYRPRVKAKGTKYECLACGETW